MHRMAWVNYSLYLPIDTGLVSTIGILAGLVVGLIAVYNQGRRASRDKDLKCKNNSVKLINEKVIVEKMINKGSIEHTDDKDYKG